MSHKSENNDCAHVGHARIKMDYSGNGMAQSMANKGKDNMKAASADTSDPKSDSSSKSNPAQSGQRPRAIFDGMRTRAWVVDLLRRTGAKGYAELNRVIFGIEWTKKNPTSDPFKKLPQLSWSRYGTGERAPDGAAISLVEQNSVCRGARLVLEVGPEEDRTNVPLWRPLEEHADFAHYLDDMLDDMGIERGTRSRTDAVLSEFAEPAAWAVARSGHRPMRPADNPVMRSISDRYFQPTLYRFALALTAWRLAMVESEDADLFESMVINLISGPVKSILEHHRIFEGIRDLVGTIAIEYHLARQDLASAVRVRDELGLRPLSSGPDQADGSN